MEDAKNNVSALNDHTAEHIFLPIAAKPLVAKLVIFSVRILD